MKEIGRGRTAFAAALALVVLLARAGVSTAQDGTETTPPAALGASAEGAPSLSITSDPPGVVVTLRGPYEWIGVTPWKIYREVAGLYRIEARRPGYETWESEIVLGPGGIRDLKIELARKTTFKIGRAHV